MKKPMLNLLTTIACVFAVTTAWASDNWPEIEFVKDGEVIERRVMNNEEYQAYSRLHELEQAMEKLEVPLSQLEQQIDDHSQEIEDSIAHVAIRTLSNGEDEIEYAREPNHQEFEALVNIKQLVAQMQPAIDEITLLADDLTEVAHQFELALMRDYQQGQVDVVRVIDGEQSHQMHFNHLDDKAL